jgi:hypothetical protein
MTLKTGQSRGDVTLLADDILIDAIVIETGRRGPVLEEEGAKEGEVVVA